ncbi:bile salt-activated lipase isoform X10 [Macaca thibetana thibetana]|uniref:bile salt-activated lipase isoform X9 n=1 Tax=Macaca thibetana thibetana TaxID=257877 RepID=UPI0021BCFA3E|nr:bile salt-activated lipase isoform X9 [Macaca thibetana thibetana]XP_050615859.1 bile salt-activated lipase isoform X10 [Macaca thibetana thibetana]
MPFSLTVTLSPVNKPEGRALCTLPGPATPLATCFCSQLGPVYTEGGFVEGVNKKLGLLGDSVDIFKGIPFAAPTKALENPQPHPGWQGTLKAKSFKKRCLQATITQDSTYGDEDCLYLNIWVPQDRKQVSRDLPVMIWIYGGAFLMGSGHGANFLSNYLYDGEEIATRGNVIVVTFNYRVGPLGFLSTGDANLPGNYGLRDQHMAIAWVKRNIAAFGGDPNNITLFGESAGGASVSLQTLSPYNKGLIRRAISQSGVALSPWVIQKNPLFWAKKVAEKVGCPVDDTARMAKCLKVTDPRALTLAYKMPLAGMEYPMLYYLGFIPVIDGDFIPDDPINLYANAADIDYIAGINNMDGHLFASIDMPAINKNNKEVTEEDFYKLVSGLTMTKGLRGAKTTFDVYTESWAQDPSQENKKKTVVDFETDILFLVPTEIALAQHRANAKSAKTYSYLFSHPSRMPVYPKWMGADHADDIQYVFGKPFATPSGYRPQDRTVSKAMIAYWTNFAKTGDPNMGHSAVPTQWEPYTSENGSYLEITKKMDGSSVKRGLRTNFLRYWTLTYVALPTVTDQEATPVPPTGDSEATPVPPTGDSEATPVPPTGDSEATPVPPTGDSEATPVPPTGDSEATPVPPTGDSEATPVPPTGDSEATPVHPSGDSEAAPVPPTDYSKGAQMPVVISF